MTNARVREALTAGANVKDKGPHVADGVLTVTPDAPEVAEWRAKCPLDCGGPSSAYLDDDDDGPKPNELYGKFTWKIENFSEISKRELRSNVFDVGNYKWYILVYPQGCDVCNHLSLFLCVADYDKLLPGWSHFAQFTIAVVNKDPKKSKYSDTLHRFCKKEHDWGWKKFMELSKVLDGFTVAGTLVIKAQVQVILDKPSRPFRCLDPQYRRELVRVYLTNVEAICRRVCEEKRMKMAWVRENLPKFRQFWNELSPEQQKALMTEKADVILKGIVKQFFNEKEVTSTLVMDALLSGCKQIEEHSRLLEEGKSPDGSPSPCVIINADKNFFTFGWGILDLLESCSKDFLPTNKDDKQVVQGADGLGLRSGQDGDDYRRDSIERDEKRLAELGRRSVEMYVIAHLFSEQLEIAFRDAEALKRQDQLIAEEEEAERREESRLQAKAVADREKRAKKKERKKQKREAERARKEAEELERRRSEEEQKLQSAANMRTQQESASSAPAQTASDAAPSQKAIKRNKKKQQQQQQSASNTTQSTPSTTAKDLNGPSRPPPPPAASTPDKARLPNGKARATPATNSSTPSASATPSSTELFCGEPRVPPPSNSGTRTFDRAVASRPSPATRLTAAAVGTLPNAKPDVPAIGRKSTSSTCSSSSSSSRLSNGPLAAKAHSRSITDRTGADTTTDGCTTSNHTGHDGQSSRDSSLERGSEEIIRALQERVLYLERELVGRDAEIVSLKAQVAELEGQLQQSSSSSSSSSSGPQQVPQAQAQHSEERDRWVQAARPGSRGPTAAYTPDYNHQDSSRTNGTDAPSTTHSHSHPHSTPAPNPSPSLTTSNGPPHFSLPSATTAPVQSWAATPDDYSREFPPLQAAVSVEPPQPPSRHTSAASSAAAAASSAATASSSAAVAASTAASNSSTTTIATPAAPGSSSSSAGNANADKEAEKPETATSSSGPTVQSPSSTAQEEVGAGESSTEPAAPGPSTSSPAAGPVTEPAPPVSTTLTPPLGTSTLLTPPNLPPSIQANPAPAVSSSQGSGNIPMLSSIPPLAPLRRGQLPYGDTSTNGSAASSPQTLSSSPAAPSSTAPSLAHPSSSMRIPSLSHPNRVPPTLPIPSQSASPSDQLSTLSSSHSQLNQPLSPVTPQLLTTPGSPKAATSEPAPLLLRTQSMPSHLEARKDYGPVVLLEHTNGRHTPSGSLPATGSSLMTPAAAITRVRSPLDHAALASPSAGSTPTAKSGVSFIPTSTASVLPNGVSSLSLHSVSSGDFSKQESGTPSYRNAAATGVMAPGTSASSLSQPQLQGSIPASSAPVGLSPASVMMPVPTSMASSIGPIPPSSKPEDVVVVTGNGVGGGSQVGPTRGFGPAPSRFALNQQNPAGMGFGIHSKVAAMGQRPRHVSPSENPGLDDFAHINLITDLLTD